MLQNPFARHQSQLREKVSVLYRVEVSINSEREWNVTTISSHIALVSCGCDDVLSMLHLQISTSWRNKCCCFIACISLLHCCHGVNQNSQYFIPALSTFHCCGDVD